MASKRKIKKIIKKNIRILENALDQLDFSMEFVTVHAHLKANKHALRIIKNL